MLQNNDVCDLVLRDPTFAPAGFLCDICDGSIYKDHTIFQQDPKGLQLMLYFDDVEICNPLGKGAGTHKVGLFYYTVGNLAPIYRARLPAVRLIAIIRRKVMNNCGIDMVIRRINQDLEMLSNGIELNLNNVRQVVRGACCCFCGDTLAAHEFAGFKLGVGFSFQKCRECECTFQDMQTRFTENEFLPRSLNRYDDQCRMLNYMDNLRSRLSTAYGLNRRSAARDIPHFNLTSMVPEDLMHVIFEGVAPYEIKIALKNMIEEGIFRLQDINSHIENFPYGYKEKESRPVRLPDNMLNSPDNSLGQSSGSMIVLLRLIPIILYELQVNFQNDHFKFIVELCEIVKILLAPIITIETINLLEDLIAVHLRNFKHLYPNKNIIPKQHYMVHFPSTLKRYGPLRNIWCMRFEGKHQFFKERMSGNHNFKNVEKTLSERCCMYECALNCSSDHALFKNDSGFGKSKRIPDLDHGKDMIHAFFGTERDAIHSINEVSWAVYKGVKYVPSQCCIGFGEQNGMPEFGELQYIWVVNVLHNHDMVHQIYFGLKMYVTVKYDEHVLAYEVQEPMVAQGLELVYIDNIFVHQPLYLYKAREKSYIITPYDLIDTTRLKSQ